MTDGQSQCISRVSWLRHLLKSQQSLDHKSDLRLLSSTMTGHGRLDLTWGVKRHRKITTGSARNRNGSGLRRSHDGPNVVLAEYPLHSHRIRVRLIENLLEPALECIKTSAELHVRRSADHSCGDHCK
jgi:hypothetical protein